MKSCELCKSPAKLYCDSDQASLCWTCDSKVHSANFLVARHSRNLLCRVCQSPTQWTAAGEKLGPSAVTVCDKCVVDGGTTTSDDNDDDDDDVYDGDEDSETELDVDDEDEDENQVVPLSYTPPPAASSSSSDDYSFSFRDVSVKRKRVNEEAEDEDGCLSLQKDRREVFSLESNEVIGEGNGGRLYNFMPLNSERMNEKTNSTGHRDKISAVGLDLNLPDTESS